MRDAISLITSLILLVLSVLAAGMLAFAAMEPHPGAGKADRLIPFEEGRQ